MFLSSYCGTWQLLSMLSADINLTKWTQITDLPQLWSIFWTLSSWTQTYTSEIAKKYFIKDTKFGQKIQPAASSSGSIVVVQAFDQRHVGLNKSQVGCKRTKIFISGSLFRSPGLTKDESPNIFLLHWFAYNVPYILSLAYFL